MSKYQQEHTFNQLPGLLEYFGFVFAFGNLLAGPVIEFRDYQMWVNKEGPWSAHAGRKVPFWGDMRAVRGGLGIKRCCRCIPLGLTCVRKSRLWHIAVWGRGGVNQDIYLAGMVGACILLRAAARPACLAV